MMKCMMVAVTLAACGAPASALSSLLPFAYDYDAGRPTLEFYPATAAKFTEQGRELLRLTVRVTPPERDAPGPMDAVVVVDCQSRQLAVSRAGGDGAPTPPGRTFKLSDLNPANGGTLQRFVAALCGGELIGVPVSSTTSGWVHFIEGTQRALYFVGGSGRKIGNYQVMPVRLLELGGGRLADGRRFDARDAVWVIDCERKLGAVAYERAFTRAGNDDRTVVSTGDDRAFADPTVVEVDKLQFAEAAAGSMQAQFTEASCRASP